MSVRALPALMVASGLLIAPATQYCDVRDAASMACCTGDMTGCNQPGKTEDCCRKSPASHETALELVQGHRIEKPALAMHHDLTLAAQSHAAADLGPSSVLPGTTPSPAPAPSPPLRAVLRL